MAGTGYATATSEPSPESRRRHPHHPQVRTPVQRQHPLPAAYVAEHVDLGYAVTAYRAQGTTTDTAHVLVEPTSTRETFYVAMTRGRHSNHAYVTLDRADDHTQPHPGDNPHATARSVLYGVLQHSGAELSAHETIAAEHDQWSSIAQLAVEYETIAAAAQHDRWATLLRTSGLTTDEANRAIGSDAFGALTAELRRAEANRHDLDALLPRLVAARGFGDADDIAAVLHHRIERATKRLTGSGRARKTPHLIAGLIPHAHGVTDAEMRVALDEREALIETRADVVLDTALTENASWTKAFGTPPSDEHQAAAWRRAARVIAAYRDRYRITSQTPLGPEPATAAQRSTPPEHEPLSIGCSASQRRASLRRLGSRLRGGAMPRLDAACDASDCPAVGVALR